MICGIVWKEYFSLPMDHSGSCCVRQSGKYIYIFNPMASDRAIFFWGRLKQLHTYMYPLEPIVTCPRVKGAAGISALVAVQN